MTWLRHLWAGAKLMAPALLLSACDMGPMAKMPDGELRQKMAECRTMRNPSTVKAQACANYQRECENRRDDGRFVC